LQLKKKSTEKLLVYFSPGRADILFVFFFKKQKDKGDDGTKWVLKTGWCAPEKKWGS
jgi:hypothetical protein